MVINMVISALTYFYQVMKDQELADILAWMATLK